MGEVYLAYDQRLQRRVAIKHLHRGRSSARAVERLRREAKSIAKLNHPTIVQVYDLLESDDGDWVVMELVDGSTLYDLVKKQPLRWEQALRIAREICAGLQTAHNEHIVHRDLKAENVMLTRSGRTKILDFGLAKSFWQGTSDEPGLSVKGEILGTVRAMSPEQAKGEDVDHRSDLFSLGSLLYETMTGRSPFVGTSAVHTLALLCSERQKPIRELEPAIPEDMAGLVDHLLEKRPENRPQSASDVLIALNTIAEAHLDEAQLDELRQSVSGSAWGDVTKVTMTSSQLTPTPLPTQHGLSQPGTLHGKTTRIMPTPLPARHDSSMHTPSSGLRTPSSTRTTSLSGIPQGSTTSGIFIRTLLYLEIAERDRLMSQHGDAAYELFNQHDRLVRDLMLEVGGVEVHKTESFLLLFERPVDAARFALNYQRRLADLDRQAAGGKGHLRARAGIHLGEVRMQENTLEDVNRGARPVEVEGLTKRITQLTMELALPGQVLITHAAHELARRGLQGSELMDEALWGAHGDYRFQGVGESVRIFELGLKGRSKVRRPPDNTNAHSLKGRPWWQRRRVAVAAAAVLVAILLSVVFTRRDSQSIAVLGFHNLSGKEDIAWVSRALTEILSTELAVGGNLRVISGESIARMKREIALDTSTSLADDTLRKVGRNLGVEYVVLGNYIPEAAKLRINVHLQSTRSGGTRDNFLETGTTSSLADLSSKVSSRVRGELGVEAMTEAEEKAVEATVASEEEALRLYAEGLELLLRGDALQARPLLKEAVTIDPDYALAHAALSRAWTALGYDREAVDAAKTAYDLAQNKKMPREQQLTIEGLYYESAKDWPKAISTYRALWQFFPDSLEHGLRLATVQYIAGEMSTSLATLDKLRAADPRANEDARVDLVESNAAYWLGDYERGAAAAAAAASKAAAQGAPLLRGEALYHQGWNYYFLPNIDESIRVLQEAEQIFMQHEDVGWVGKVLDALGSALMYQGRLVEAEELFAQSLSLAQKTGSRTQIASVAAHLGYLQQEIGQLSVARETILAAVESAREIGDRNREGTYADTLIWIDYKLDPLSAVELAEQNIAMFKELEVEDMQGWEYAYLARVAQATGDLEEARRLYTEEVAPRAEGEYLGAFYEESLGDLALATGDLEAARQHYERSLELRVSIEEAEGAAESKTRLVRLLLAEGKLGEAAQTGRETAEELRKTGREDLRIRCLRVAAEALLALGGDGVAVARALTERFGNSEQIVVRLMADVTRARVEALDGNVNAALRALQATEQEAVAHQLKEVELEARYSRGLIEVAIGRGRETLDSVAAEGAALGYDRIAGLAENAAAGR